MIIFDWEKSVIEIARTWPQQGPIYEFFRFWTTFSETKWLLIALIIILSIKIGWRKLVSPILLGAIAAALGDLTSRHLVKNFVLRPRPNFVGMECHLSKCWGFVSSHSTNITAVAVVLCFYDRRNIFWTTPIVLVVCFSRIYLIDHFPLDVLGGMLLGTFIGSIVWTGFRFSKNKLSNHIVINNGIGLK